MTDFDENPQPMPGDPPSAYDPPDAADVDDADEPLDRGEPESEPESAALPISGTRRRPRRTDDANYPARREAAPEALPARRGYGCADVITALFLLLSVGVVSVTVLLIANPQSPLNPFPPPTNMPRLVLATPAPTTTITLTFTAIPPTPTIPTATPTPSPTPTETPTITPTTTPVVGGISVIPAITPTAPTPANTVDPASIQSTRPAFPFSVKSIRYQANEGAEGCRWQSIAGVVLNLAGQPRGKQEGSLAVSVSGDNSRIDEFTYTGTEPRFGESGFEIFLGVVPRVADYTVELRGTTGAPISEKVTVQTREACNENVAVIEFMQNYPY